MSSKVDIDPAAESVSGPRDESPAGHTRVARPQRCRDRDGYPCRSQVSQSSLAAISKLRGDDEAHQYAKGAVFVYEDIPSMPEKDQWKCHLRIIRQCVRGLITLLPYCTGSVAERVCYAGPHYKSYEEIDALLSRAKLLGVFTNLALWLKGSRPDDTGAICGAIKLVDYTATTLRRCNGRKEEA